MRRLTHSLRGSRPRGEARVITGAKICRQWSVWRFRVNPLNLERPKFSRYDTNEINL